ncbi:RHS repeat-associated core domain-containing protein [Kallotenue papyrolyticum]|uniref:RHS repeat-associated core domain-containing protein n=1 Tax=Kallotenue papyrolyticum TaxID=1325125 RepID=UPI000492E57C|nr:RHS repeat-associated core domain-containing protein [Kallotenue papyrolyticum]
MSYSYGSNGNGTGAGPHQARTVGGQSYSYDANGNLVSGGGRTYTWQADNLPASITSGGATETYTYDADGERLTRTAGGVTTVYVGGLYEEDLQTGVTRSLYQFNGQIVAQRSSDASGLIYLHGDHLGSVSLATNASGGVVSRQEFDPWGSLRSGSISQTALNDTGQRRDGTGVLYYHARYYDPVLARFISADSVVPGAPDGSMDGVALKPLTVDFHETGFVNGLNAEHGQGFWFQLTQAQRQEANAPWGPQNPQALNRYAYVQNNPLRYTDPTGHVAWWVIGGIGGAAVGFATYALTHRGDFNWKHAALYAAGGAVVGATLGAGAHAAAGFIARAGAVGAAGATATAAQNVVKFDWKRVDHIFRNAPGHVNPSSAASQARFARLFEEVASNPNNLRSNFPLPQGAVRAGIQVYTQVFRNGEQIWVYVRNGIIQDAGVNPPGAWR